jgi:hypothetical protein
LSLLKTLRIAITDISVVIKPAVCASLAGYFTLFSLTNLAIVCMFFKFPNLVALYVSRERQCFIFTSSVIIWLLHSFWRLDRKKEWKIPMCAWLHFEYVHIGLRMNSKFHTKWSLLLIHYVCFISLFDGCSVVLFKWSIFFRLLIPKFWPCFEFSYLIASMGLQLLGVLDLHALRSKKNLQNPVLVSLFVVGDRATIFSPSLVLNYNFHRSRCLWHGWRD